LSFKNEQPKKLSFHQKTFPTAQSKEQQSLSITILKSHGDFMYSFVFKLCMLLSVSQLSISVF